MQARHQEREGCSCRHDAHIFMCNYVCLVSSSMSILGQRVHPLTVGGATHTPGPVSNLDFWWIASEIVATLR